MKNYSCISNNSNDKGGNFISSPVVDGKSFIFYFVEASVSLIQYLSENCNQDLIGLNCSFASNKARHIDECMTIMPYGTNKFKIWKVIHNLILASGDSS